MDLPFPMTIITSGARFKSLFLLLTCRAKIRFILFPIDTRHLSTSETQTDYVELFITLTSFLYYSFVTCLFNTFINYCLFKFHFCFLFLTKLTWLRQILFTGYFNSRNNQYKTKQYLELGNSWFNIVNFVALWWTDFF